MRTCAAMLFQAAMIVAAGHGEPFGVPSTEVAPVYFTEYENQLAFISCQMRTTQTGAMAAAASAFSQFNHVALYAPVAACPIRRSLRRSCRSREFRTEP